MKHPDEAALALFAGHDLGFVSEWRTRRHVARCERCREAVDGFVSLRSQLVDLGELPSDLGWNRLAPPVSPAAVISGLRDGLESTPRSTETPYGDGHAAERIVQVLLQKGRTGTGCTVIRDVIAPVGPLS